MIRHLTFTFALLFIIINSSFTQELKWKAGFNGFFDNREYFNEYAQPQSILGARTFAEGGFVIDDQNEFGIGIDYMYEFGADPSGDNISPIIYYKFHNDFAELYMGAFARRSLVNMPLVLQNDTFNYYKPNLEGIYISFYNSWGKQDVWLDWTSRQTMTDRETFLIGATGIARMPKIAYFKYDFLMYHFAGTAAENNTEVRDNGGITAVLGANLSKHTPLDSLSISTGFVGSYDRMRGVYELQYQRGSLSELYAQYKMFGLRSALYFGDGQTLMVGDPMYRAPVYNRTDVVLNVLRKGRVKGAVEFAFHFIPSEVEYSQKFTIYIDISGRKKL